MTADSLRDAAAKWAGSLLGSFAGIYLLGVVL